MSKQTAALKRLIRQIVREELSQLQSSHPRATFGEPEPDQPMHDPSWGPERAEPSWNEPSFQQEPHHDPGPFMMNEHPEFHPPFAPRRKRRKHNEF